MNKPTNDPPVHKAFRVSQRVLTPYEPSAIGHFVFISTDI